MHGRCPFIVLLLCLLFAPTSSPPQNHALPPPVGGITFEQVIRLSQSGLSDAAIIAQIKKRPQPFNLSPDELLQLKAAHVSNSVIEAMMPPSSAPIPFRDGIYRVGGDVKPPKAIYDPNPEYSDEARRAKYQASVILEVVVDAEGQPQKMRIQRAAGMGLEEQASKAVQRWRFQPATKNGQPVPVMANVEMYFSLDGPGLSPALSPPPQFAGVDTAKYPLVIAIFSAIGSPSAESYVIAASASIDGPVQQPLSLACSAEKKHCSFLGNGRYPARWLDANHRLEIAGLAQKDSKWETTNYVVTTGSIDEALSTVPANPLVLYPGIYGGESKSQIQQLLNDSGWGGMKCHPGIQIYPDPNIKVEDCSFKRAFSPSGFHFRNDKLTGASIVLPMKECNRLKVFEWMTSHNDKALLKGGGGNKSTVWASWLLDGVGVSMQGIGSPWSPSFCTLVLSTSPKDLEVSNAPEVAKNTATLNALADEQEKTSYAHAALEATCPDLWANRSCLLKKRTLILSDQTITSATITILETRLALLDKEQQTPAVQHDKQRSFEYRDELEGDLFTSRHFLADIDGTLKASN
jgi:TonB family protein